MPTFRRPRWASPAIGVAVLAVTMALTSACAGPEGGEEAPSATGGAQVSAEQQAEMADGVVTSEEYHEAFRRFAACLADQGYELVVHGEKYDLIEAGIPQAAVDAGVDEPCYEGEWKLVDMQWQLDHFDSSYTAEFAKQCLLAHDLEVPERFADREALLVENGIDMWGDADCPPMP